MAIERMKRVAAVVPTDELEGLTAWLHGRRVMHLTRVAADVAALGTSSAASPDAARDAAAAYEQILSFCESWGGARKSFLDGIFSAKTVARASDLEAAAKRLDLDALRTEVARLRERRDGIVQKTGAIEKEIELLRPFAGVSIPLGDLVHARHVRMLLVRLARRAQENLERAVPEAVAWERLSEDLVWMAAPAGDAHADELVASLCGAAEEIPSLDGVTRERIDALGAARRKLVEDLDRVDAECRAFAGKAHDVELALGFWQSETHRLKGLEDVLRSPRLGVLQGYLPAAELDRFAVEVRTRFRGEVLAEDPVRGETVPVRIAVGRFMRPMTLLVNMFGLPDYFSVDPTPFVAFVFLAFFGLCYSDAVYGIGLMLLALALMRKFRRHRGLRDFCQIFLYGGASTVVFGMMLGSWASDLCRYLPKGNFLETIRDATFLFNPLDKPMVALAGVIAIGIANQYFGIVVRMWRDARRGDWKGAVYDGALWLLYLSGVVLLCASVFVEMPGVLANVALCALAAGAVGLVLTQGRAEKTLFLKYVTGVVSLYGILGTYGATSFIGDTLSYSRLLALGLTTGIVGMSFNLLGNILSSVPAVGTALFVAIVVFGHLFNFLMSIIGSFVHSARLILLEFFGRFYEPGSCRFEAFGFRSERIELLEGGS